jgi:hypothetical protein
MHSVFEDSPSTCVGSGVSNTSETTGICFVIDEESLWQLYLLFAYKFIGWLSALLQSWHIFLCTFNY